ncbi:thermonuclease family protein [Sphingopyxis sp. PAMC25046]|uniref:thermonuclease family protein n=1 Tax=Sphingopyxis sp. PAMC25046 TaxID=2565556 RepID=UPI001B350E10|nr:thermonuclease family protein [Sphingopyxis sp. PAMC25046]
MRRRRPARGWRRHVGSNLWLTPIMVVAFVAALATFQRFPAGSDAVPAAAFFAGEGKRGRDALSARFGFCYRGGGRDCVVDGDTFWFAGEKYRVADIDTPETHPARCAEEAALGEAATGRLRDWLNAGTFSLEDTGRDTDRYGRKLRIVTRDGASVGSVLVTEGLARPWEGRRRPWC